MSLCYEQNIFKDDADPVSRHVQVFRICLLRNDKYESLTTLTTCAQL